MVAFADAFKMAGNYLVTTRDILGRTERIATERIQGGREDTQKALTYVGTGIASWLALEGLVAAIYNYKFDPLANQLATGISIFLVSLVAAFVNLAIVSIGSFKLHSVRKSLLIATYIQGTGFALSIAGTALNAVAMAPLWSRIRAAGDFRACSPLQVQFDPLCKSEKVLSTYVFNSSLEPGLSLLRILIVTSWGASLLLVAYAAILTLRAGFVFNHHVFGFGWLRWLLTVAGLFFLIVAVVAGYLMTTLSGGA